MRPFLRLWRPKMPNWPRGHWEGPKCAPKANRPYPDVDHQFPAKVVFLEVKSRISQTFNCHKTLYFSDIHHFCQHRSDRLAPKKILGPKIYKITLAKNMFWPKRWFWLFLTKFGYFCPKCLFFVPRWICMTRQFFISLWNFFWHVMYWTGT